MVNSAVANVPLLAEILERDGSGPTAVVLPPVADVLAIVPPPVPAPPAAVVPPVPGVLLPPAAVVPPVPGMLLPPAAVVPPVPGVLLPPTAVSPPVAGVPPVADAPPVPGVLLPPTADVPPMPGVALPPVLVPPIAVVPPVPGVVRPPVAVVPPVPDVLLQPPVADVLQATSRMKTNLAVVCSPMCPPALGRRLSQRRPFAKIDGVWVIPPPSGKDEPLMVGTQGQSWPIAIWRGHSGHGNASPPRRTADQRKGNTSASKTTFASGCSCAARTCRHHRVSRSKGSGNPDGASVAASTP